MKKIILVLVTYTFVSISYSQVTGRCVFLEKLRDSLYLKKNNYVGKPLSKLIKDLKVPVSFSRPDNIGRATIGIKYYKNTTLYLECLDGFKIEIANKVNIDIKEYKSTNDEIWDKKMAYLLGKEILISLQKFP